MEDKGKMRKRNEKKTTKRKDTTDKTIQDDDTCYRKRENGKKEKVDYLSSVKVKQEKKSEKMERRKLAELTEAFHIFDFDQDGIISFSDLKQVYTSLGNGEVDDEEIKQMISEGITPLDFNAFVKLMGLKILDLDDEDTLVEALSQWDYGNGLISEERIRHDLMTWGDRFTEEEADAALEHAPIIMTENKEKMIDYVQFSNDLCGFRKIKNLLKGN